MSNFIYALECPQGHIRYVGKSKDPFQRLKEHIRSAKAGSRHHCGAWIRKLLDTGCEPTVRILEEVPDGESWQAAEIRLIAEHRALGCRLTNSTAGGEGATITCPLLKQKAREASILAHARPEVKAKDSANSLANWARPEYREKHARSMARALKCPKLRQKKAEDSINRWKDPEYKKALVERHKQINSDPEYVRARIAKAAIGNAKPEVRAQRSKSASQANNRPDVKAKNTAAQKALWADPEYRARQHASRVAGAARRKAEKAAILAAIDPAPYTESS